MGDDLFSIMVQNLNQNHTIPWQLPYSMSIKPVSNETLGPIIKKPVLEVPTPMTLSTFKNTDSYTLLLKRKQGLGKLGNSAISAGINALSSQVTDKLTNGLDDTEVGRNVGTVLSSGISSATDTISNNILKGNTLLEGLDLNLEQSIAGAGVGIAGNYIGQGINALGGDSMLSRGLGLSTATAIGSIGGLAVSNLLNGLKAFSGISQSIGAIRDFNKTKSALNTAILSGNNTKLLTAAKATYDTAKGAANLAKLNLGGLGASIVGAGLSAAFGPSKEYGGKYGNITLNMDMAYDLISAGVGFVPGIGTAISGAMVLNKGLSNIFGSTSGMTKTDAILGSAFMPAPVKWLNVAGAKTTDSFDKQSWLNTERTNAFMGNAFGNLKSKFDRAREEAGKTYGTFSRGAYRSAQANIDFANLAWDKILTMTDLNELQNIRSLAMSSINNQRYAQQLMGGFKPLQVGKLGMKIFNNATNHNIGMRLLSGAALIDNKQMILSAQGGTKVIHPRPKPHRKGEQPVYTKEEKV